MMTEEFYIVDKPVSVKETFDNTILLLTMIKSEYYYIISFSRAKGQIEIGFDFDSGLHNKITETIMADFYSNENCVTLSCVLKNIDLSDLGLISSLGNDLKITDSSVIYKSEIHRDNIIPISIKSLNSYIMKARCDIISFLETYYQQCVLNH